MALYETVFIARQDLTAEGVDAITDKFAKIIADKGGKVVSREYWGLRTLAYRINKGNRGHYVMLNIDADYPAVAELNRVIGFSEDIIRNSTFKVGSHEKESALFVAEKAKGYKPSKEKTKKDLTELDKILDKIQFEA